MAGKSYHGISGRDWERKAGFWNPRSDTYPSADRKFEAQICVDKGLYSCEVYRYGTWSVVWHMRGRTDPAGRKWIREQLDERFRIEAPPGL